MQTGLSLAYGRGMTRMCAHWLALLPALWLLLPLSSASAQAGSTGSSVSNSGGVSWQVVTIGSDKYFDSSYKVPINKKQCDSNALVQLSLTAIPAGFKYLEIWAGVQCAEGIRATRGTNTIPPCKRIDYKEQDTTVTANTNFVIPASAWCDQDDGMRSVFILPVNTLEGSDNVATYANVALTVDRTPPSAPSNVVGGAGETEIPVSWSQPSDSFYY
jgi:hypothetical protein